MLFLTYTISLVTDLRLYIHKHGNRNLFLFELTKHILYTPENDSIIHNHLDINPRTTDPANWPPIKLNTYNIELYHLLKHYNIVKILYHYNRYQNKITFVYYKKSSVSNVLNYLQFQIMLAKFTSYATILFGDFF